MGLPRLLACTAPTTRRSGRGAATHDLVEQIGEMTRAADWVVTVYDDGVAQTFERMIDGPRAPLRPDGSDEDEGV